MYCNPAESSQLLSGLLDFDQYTLPLPTLERQRRLHTPSTPLPALRPPRFLCPPEFFTLLQELHAIPFQVVDRPGEAEITRN